MCQAAVDCESILSGFQSCNVTCYNLAGKPQMIVKEI
jgi:hypothetical protein